MLLGEGCFFPTKSFLLSNFWDLAILKKINTEGVGGGGLFH